LRRLELGAGSGLVEFGPEHRVAAERVVQLVQRPGGRYRLDGPTRLRLRIAAADAAARVAAADAVLDDLGG
jgi:transcription-repair coupling factor (superfamily II helicase)